MLLMIIKINVLFTIIQFTNVQAVDWNGNNWAFACDFRNNDLSNARVPGEECGGLCARTSGCTHFTWTKYNNGTCWMKSGAISKNSAFDTNDRNMVCGVISEVPPTPTPPGPPSGNKFPYCKFRFGAETGNRDFSQVDYITAWIGYSSNINNDMIQQCINNKKMPVYYAYIAAFMAKNTGLKDCDVAGNSASLCTQGANFIRNNRNQIVERYRQLAQQTAAKIGSSAEIIWLIEPDFVQYYREPHQSGGTLSGSYMRSLFDDFVKAIKSSLPNARISWDISPWLTDQEMRTWWGYFASASIDYIHTSGGRTNAGAAQIRDREQTWRFMSSLTGKKIIADTGYGVGGGPTGHAKEWDDVNNLKARISDGVIAISQHDPKGDWGNTIKSVRNSLPALC